MRKPHPVKTTFEWFWNFVKFAGKDECWEWQGYISPDGYGRVHPPFLPRLFPNAHRVAWMLTNGHVPAGMFVCHKCDNRRCVNPGHLFLGTPADNMHDRDAKGRASGGSRPGELNAKAKLTNANVLHIRERYKRGGVLQRELAAEYGVNRSIIGKIVTNRIWTKVAQSVPAAELHP